ncbi:hypothetical protein TL16_g07259 [Triparma laevis f. inornata]|uniref:Uncharacterized protein n=2 Tax=Triparma laevis TaxID=1534972 RepID=A0A9W7KT80_9STRA|nr:hypothetical protein TL16_g07259 [Triparma laevis f. inornata]GMI10490.1 hypothetical protein TrLO_g8351 [Triparma laevis f. longispina]
MRMTTQSGFCTNADCTETMIATVMENPWTTTKYNAAIYACWDYGDKNEPWIYCAMFFLYLLTLKTIDGVLFKMCDIIELLKRNEDSDPFVLMFSKALINAGLLLLRMVLVNKYSNKYTDSAVTLFVDLFLLFVFAEIVDFLFSLITTQYFNAVKSEMKDFDEA